MCVQHIYFVIEKLHNLFFIRFRFCITMQYCKNLPFTFSKQFLNETHFKKKLLQLV